MSLTLFVLPCAQLDADLHKLEVAAGLAIVAAQGEATIARIPALRNAVIEVRLHTFTCRGPIPDSVSTHPMRLLEYMQERFSFVNCATSNLSVTEFQTDGWNAVSFAVVTQSLCGQVS